MPRDGRPTRDRILTAAEQLVIENGYAATSVDQVIASSGTSKGSFFHHFESKRALADALVDRYVAADIENLEAGLAAAREGSDDPAERVVAFVRHFEDRGDEIMQAQSGCLYTSILTERELVATGASDPITKAVLAWREGITDLLREALPEPRGLDLEAVADHVFVTFEGAFMLARTTGDPGRMRAQLRVLRELLEALLRAGRQ